MLILGTYRETEVDEAHPLGQAIAELRRARALDTVTLGGLGEGEVAELISSQLAGAAPATVARSIVERTQGNPFFVEEILRDVGPDGDVSDALTRIPDSVKDLLLRRLRRLDEGCKRLLTIAAVSRTRVRTWTSSSSWRAALRRKSRRDSSQPSPRK